MNDKEASSLADNIGRAAEKLADSGLTVGRIAEKTEETLERLRKGGDEFLIEAVLTGCTAIAMIIGGDISLPKPSTPESLVDDFIGWLAATVTPETRNLRRETRGRNCACTCVARSLDNLAKALGTALGAGSVKKIAWGATSFIAASDYGIEEKFIAATFAAALVHRRFGKPLPAIPEGDTTKQELLKVLTDWIGSTLKELEDVA